LRLCNADVLPRLAASKAQNVDFVAGAMLQLNSKSFRHSDRQTGQHE